jgi:hypothetical protein
MLRLSVRSINMFMSPVGHRTEKGCDGVAQQKLKTTDPTSRQKGAPHPHLKIIKERRGNIGRRSQMGA